MANNNLSLEFPLVSDTPSGSPVYQIGMPWPESPDSPTPPTPPTPTTPTPPTPTPPTPTPPVTPTTPATDTPTDTPTATPLPSITITRGPRRCTVCRQTGHDRRNCDGRVVEGVTIRRLRRTCTFCGRTDHTARYCSRRMGGITYLGALTNVYGDNRRNFAVVLFNRMTQWIPELLTIGRFFMETLSDRIENYVFNMSYTEFVREIQSPLNSINSSYILASNLVSEIESNSNRIILGSEYAKNIELDLQCLKGEVTECGICFDNKCGVKTGCGHEFCRSCVLSIIYTNKDKTEKPVCAFCRAPFSKFTVSDTFEYVEIQNFINNLA